ncbi:MAG: putative lipid II flippase FtsW [Gammaproteobacteria bacterium]|jgi:cell division protein FtsW|nr:putative lipid II flippase FtsW [Gammaproteobacteria bacterium]HJP37956.1 putative lipid II flippase FtsW [Gammaproteobacteria bacterium]
MTVATTMRKAHAGRTVFDLDQHIDWVFVLIVATLLCVGLVMLTSASISLADRNTGNPLFYFERQLLAVVIGLCGAAFMLWVPTSVWERYALLLVCLALGMLIAVLIPGLGNTVNGSTRWLSIGGISIMQVSEPARLLMLMYLSGYAVRHRAELQERFIGFAKPMSLVGLTCLLLLLEPDFGASVVMLTVSLAVLFIAGARLRDFLVSSLSIGSLLVMIAFMSPYRLKRLTGFLDPWSDPFGTGFQLVQSLIAIGSGQWFGVGLGGSVQKLFYLPEAHTDFVFAVIAEEFGLIGSVLLITVFVALVWRVLRIAANSAALGRLYQANLSFGVAIWLGVQVFINIGVNMGILPTKGLTLPLISYGRSSMLITLLALGLLLRIEMENRQIASQGVVKGKGKGRRRVRKR